MGSFEPTTPGRNTQERAELAALLGAAARAAAQESLAEKSPSSTSRGRDFLVFLLGLALGASLGFSGALVYWLEKKTGDQRGATLSDPPSPVTTDRTIESDPSPLLQPPTRPNRDQAQPSP